MVDGSFFCAKLTSRRGGHTLFVQTGAEASDSGAEVVKSDPRCSWQSHPGSVGADVGDESMESPSVVQPLRISLVIRPVRRTYVVVRWTVSCAAGRNGCLDLSCRAFPPSDSVRAGWIKCAGSMVRCAKQSRLAPLPRRSAGWMPASKGRLSASVGRKQPVAVRRASLITKSMRRVWTLWYQAGDQYSMVEWTRAEVATLSTPARASKLPLQKCDAWCQLFAKWLKVSWVLERPVQPYCEVFGHG